MKFYGNGVVWDKDNNRRLCKFTRAAKRGVKGMLETEDKRTIKILIGLGYEHEGETPEVKEVPKFAEGGVIREEEKPGPEPSLDDLKKKAKELGITFAPNIGYEKLLDRITEALKENAE
jgi:hypothetical protein